MIYLDANATEILRPAARAALLAALALPGNPNSVHAAGRAARGLVEQARRTIAGRLGARPAGLVFTSGGTEADALAIHALGAGRRVIASATEHLAILSHCPAHVSDRRDEDTALLPVEDTALLPVDGTALLPVDGTALLPVDGTALLPVDANGIARLDRLDEMLRAGNPALVCLMLANNETGTLQPVADAAALCRRHGARLHVDAVQAVGRIEVDLGALGADSMAVSAHKFGGPKGVGALLLAADDDLSPLIRGGGQERGRRGGTPAVASIASFAAGLDAADPVEFGRLAVFRDEIERAAAGFGAIVLGGGAERLANTSCLALPGRAAHRQVIALDLAGFAVSAGAACSSGRVSASHVLVAMGAGELANCAIRVSLSWSTVKQDVTAFIAAYGRMAQGYQPLVA